MKVHLVSLGCARNQVDSEVMAGRLSEAGMIVTVEPEAADVIVVNTCSFIAAAADESIDAILNLAGHKRDGCCRRLVVTGCLPERYREAIVDALPEVDVFLGTGAYDRIVSAVQGNMGPSKCLLPSPDHAGILKTGAQRRLTDPHLAYLKIAEGCSRRCTYCIIPRLRGRQKSRPMQAILREAAELVHSGVKELVLVAQDTTAYGRDLGWSGGLAGLLARLAEAVPDVWIRVMYGHPESLDRQTIRAVGELAPLCRYFDLPMQHASDSVLQRMGRRYGADELRTLVETIRTRIPDAAIRTTFIVGFPGETDKDFQRLMNFVEQMRFDHLGAFTYSDGEDLPSHRLPDHVPKRLARERYDQLMQRQTDIAADLNRRYVGQTYRVLVEENPETDVFIGRTAFQAPEVDGVTFVHAQDLAVGCFVDVHISDALEYDLIGNT